MSQKLGYKIRYHVVTVTEGGADFDDFDTIASLVRFFREMTDADVVKLARAQLGDEFTVDGCSRGYVLKATNS